MITTAVWTTYTSKYAHHLQRGVSEPRRAPRPPPCDPVYLVACHAAPLLPCTPATLPQCLSSAAEGNVPLRVATAMCRSG